MTTNIPPATACALFKAGVQKGLAKLDACKLESPERFELEINFKDCVKAHRGSYYPGAEKINPTTVRFVGKDIQEMMAARMFIL